MPNTPMPGTPPARERIHHLEEPDFSQPLLQIALDRQSPLLERLRCLYGANTAQRTLPELLRSMKVPYAHKPPQLREAEAGFEPHHRFTQRDVLLIAYGDSIHGQGQTGLSALASFLDLIQHRTRLFSTLHVLPFFPYSSDRGFSITDFRVVSKDLGSWEDINRLGESYRMMFDGVVNHASSKSMAFREMLSGNPDYRDFAVSFKSEKEFSPEHRKLLRCPRTSDVLTQYGSLDGPVWGWTTFSPDQIDLNYKNPKVLLNVIDTLLFYVWHGADLLRLDAVTYLWDELGTSGASLSQTSRRRASRWLPRPTSHTTKTPPTSAIAPTKGKWYITSPCRLWRTLVRIVGGILLGEGRELRRQVVEREDGIGWTNRYTGSAIDTGFGINEKMACTVKLRLVFLRMNAVDRTSVHAELILGAGVDDDVCHRVLQGENNHPRDSAQ